MLKAVVHPMNGKILPDMLSSEVPSHPGLQKHRSLLLHAFKHYRPDPDHHVVLPCLLNLNGRLVPDSLDDTEPGPHLCFSPPALDPDSGFYLSLREHFLTHENLNGCRIIVLEDLVSFFLI